MSRRTSDRGPTQRQLRAGELIRHALVDIIAREDLRDPDLHGVSVTICEVRTSPDLRQATVFCAPLGGGDVHVVAKALNRASAFLRGRLSREIETKFTPTLHFLPDVSFDAAQAMDRLFAQPEVRRDIKAPDVASDQAAREATRDDDSVSDEIEARDRSRPDPS